MQLIVLGVRRAFLEPKALSRKIILETLPTKKSYLRNYIQNTFLKYSIILNRHISDKGSKAKKYFGQLK